MQSWGAAEWEVIHCGFDIRKTLLTTLHFHFPAWLIITVISLYLPSHSMPTVRFQLRPCPAAAKHHSHIKLLQRRVDAERHAASLSHCYYMKTQHWPLNAGSDLFFHPSKMQKLYFYLLYLCFALVVVISPCCFMNFLTAESALVHCITRLCW